MGRHSSGVRAPRSSSSAGSASYQLVAGATSDVYVHQAAQDAGWRVARRPDDEQIELQRAVDARLALHSDYPLTQAFTGRQYRRPDLVGVAAPRAASVADSGAGAVVDGCGGHCVTCEHVCSYVLQVVFVLGALTGVSLCIAGVALRRTRSRDLQVLRYIGAMGALVCGALLAVQCRVRSSLRRRKRAAPHTLELRHLHTCL